jgi:hypothetical protein
MLIHTKEEKETAERLLSILNKPDINIYVLLLESVESKDIKKFIEFFNGASTEEDNRLNTPSHVIVMSPLPTQWFDFLAGFSCGSRISLLIYGQEAISGISKEFAFCFSFIQAEDSLNTFFEAEYKVFQKQEAARDVIRAQETLLRMGIPVNAEALSHCANEGNAREVGLFLAAGFSPDTRNKAGVPLLHIAARNGNHDVLQYLVSAGAQLDLQADDRGTSALIDAAMAKKHGLVKDLVAAGADLNIKSKDGQTALILAVGSSEKEIVEMLLKAGADPDISDSLGVSARNYAALFHKEEIIKLFNTYAPA